MSLWDNWEDERSCDEGYWHAHTRRVPWGLPVVGTVQVHCSRRRLLRRGLEFHVCTINKSVYTKKVWKLIVYPSYIYIYIYIHTHAVYIAQLVGAVEYTDFPSTEGWDPSPKSVLKWHWTIWWLGSSYVGAFGNAEHPFTTIVPKSNLGPIYGVNRTKHRTYAKLYFFN